MKTIIISDLHNRVYWIEDALSSPLLQPYDRVLFLGDYFDDFGDTPEDVYIAATWLKNSLKKPNRIHLMGTHDLWYRFPYNPYIEATGNTDEKEKVINSILSTRDWNLLKLYHFEQNYLISHAGLHIYLISEYVFKNKNIFNRYIIDGFSLHLDAIEIINKIIEPATKEALKDVELGNINSWLVAGIVRAGVQPVGGVIWLDWNEEFEPIPSLNQIVGHTELKYPRENSTENSKNYDLDTRNHHIGILENGIFTWIDNIYLYASKL